MASVESLGVYSIHVAHHSRKVAFRCPKTKMIVVSHERIGEDFNSPQPKSFGHRVKERLTVPVVRKCRLPCGAPIHDVVERPGILDSERTRHERLIAKQFDYSTLYLTPK